MLYVVIWSLKSFTLHSVIHAHIHYFYYFLLHILLFFLAKKSYYIISYESFFITG